MESMTTNELAEVALEMLAEDTTKMTSANTFVFPTSLNAPASNNCTNTMTEPLELMEETAIASVTTGRTCLCSCDSSIYTFDNHVTCTCNATCSCADACSALSSGICTCFCGSALGIGLDAEKSMSPSALHMLMGDGPPVQNPAEELEISEKLHQLYQAHEALKRAHEARETDLQWFKFNIDQRVKQLEQSLRNFQQHQSELNFQLVASVQRQDRNMEATRGIMENVWQRCDEAERHLRKLCAKNRKRFTSIKASTSIIDGSDVTDTEVSTSTVLPVGLTRSEM